MHDLTTRSPDDWFRAVAEWWPALIRRNSARVLAKPQSADRADPTAKRMRA
jgi:hypothetical protein